MSDTPQARPTRWAFRILIALAVLLVAIAAVGPATRDAAISINYEQRDHAPSKSLPLGADEFGKDILSRILYGLRSTLVFGLGAAILWGGLCVAVGALGRQLRRLWRNRAFGVLVDFAIGGISLGIAGALCMDWLDPDAGWFQKSNGTSSPGFERITAALALYEPSVLLFIAIGIWMGIWISRSSSHHGRMAQWMLVGLLSLAALAIRAEPHLDLIGASVVQPPSATLGSLIEQRVRYASTTQWWYRVPLVTLWVVLSLTAFGVIALLASRLASTPTTPTRRLPIYLVGAAWAVALTGHIWRFIALPVAEWSYWISVGLAGVALVWCAVEFLRSSRGSQGRSMYLAAIACAIPLALDWPIAKALDFAIPRMLF